MSKEAVLRVREAEEQASAIIENARAEAAKIVKEATERAEADIIAHEKNLQAEYKRRVAQVKEDAEALIAERIDEAVRDTVIMQEHAGANAPYATNKVIRRIMDECQ